MSLGLHVTDNLGHTNKICNRPGNSNIQTDLRHITADHKCTNNTHQK